MNEIEEGRRVLKIEAQSILDLAERLGENFKETVDLFLNCKGKLIFTGIGKSGQIAQKICSTFTSTGTPSFFLHPAESSHGDLGVITESDIVVAISYGGGSHELDPVIQFISRRGVPLVSMTGNPKSKLAQASVLSLDISVKEEACSLGLAPTSSSTVTLALGDALAMATLKKRGF